MNASLGRYWQQEGVGDATAAKEHLSLRGLVRHLRRLVHDQDDVSDLQGCAPPVNRVLRECDFPAMRVGAAVGAAQDESSQAKLSIGGQ